MKKYFIWLLLLVFCISLAFAGMGCKGEEVAKEEPAAEEPAAEEPAAGEAEEEEELVLREEEVDIRFGLTPFVDYGPWLIAIEKGWFEEEGINLEVINLASDGEIAEAMAGGAIDMGVQSPDSALSLYPENPDLRIALINTLFRGFYITGQKQYKTYDEFLTETGDAEEAAKLVCSQLDGKTILTELGSVHETIVMAAVERGGLTREDVKIIDVAGPAEGVAAFIRGEGDFFTLGLPQALRLESEGYSRTIPGPALGAGGINLSGLQVSKQYYEENKDIIVKVAKVWYKSVAYLHANPVEGLHIIVDWLNKEVGAGLDYDSSYELITRELSFPGGPIETWFWFYEESSPYHWKTKLDYRLNMMYEFGLIPEGTVDLDEMVVSMEIERLVRKVLSEEQQF